MSVLVFVDGVIRRPADHSIILDGSAIYKSFNENYRVLLVTDDKEKTDIWLKKQNLAKKIDDIVQIDDSPLGDNAFRTVERERSKGKIDFVMTDDVELTRKLIEAGIPTLVFLNPRYTRPEFRPDTRTGVKSWEAITDEMDKQQDIYREDTRLSEDYDPFSDDA